MLHLFRLCKTISITREKFCGHTMSQSWSKQGQRYFLDFQKKMMRYLEKFRDIFDMFWNKKLLIFVAVCRKIGTIKCYEKNSLDTPTIEHYKSQIWWSYDKNFYVNLKNSSSPRNAYLRMYIIWSPTPCWLRSCFNW